MTPDPSWPQAIPGNYPIDHRADRFGALPSVP